MTDPKATMAMIGQAALGASLLICVWRGDLEHGFYFMLALTPNMAQGIALPDEVRSTLGRMTPGPLPSPPPAPPAPPAPIEPKP